MMDRQNAVSDNFIRYYDDMMNGVVSDLTEQIYDEVVSTALFEIASHTTEVYHSDYVPISEAMDVVIE